MNQNIELKKIYDKTFKKKNRVRETDEFKEVLKMDKWKGKHILDVGCGTGRLAYMIAKKGGKVKGIDYSTTAIKTAQSKYNHPNLSYEKVDVSKNISGKYDIIISIGTLEHMDKPYSMLKKFKNHLEPKGKIILTSPNWTNARGFILMTLQMLFDAPITLADLHYFTPVDFMRWAKKLELKLSWKTIEYSWGNGDKMIDDLKNRLPKIFKDIKLGVKQKNINLFLKWINQKVVPVIQSSEENGAIGIYVLSKKK
ncbi:MAG: class I SAM-dependent methyltransferase [Candidatus Nitrosopelagicus sp.]|nr:class I SAM-dependent methyltransferase [Candidatus Nitrosopelagicus sp.]